MKYVESIVIERPRDTVVALFEDQDTYGQWQDGLVSVRPLSGTPGQAGARRELVYRRANRVVEVIETLEEQAMPDRCLTLRESFGMWRRDESHFEVLEEGVTEWTMLCQVRPTGFLPRLAARLLPQPFRRETRANMEALRDFAERG